MSSVLKLIHTEGTKAGRVDHVDFASLPQQTLTLGRDPSCILAFDAYKDPRVSAHHSDIRFEDGRYFLIDRGSTNGTRINGLKIFDRAELHPGDEVELGRKGSRFQVEFVPDEEAKQHSGSSVKEGKRSEDEPPPTSLRDPESVQPGQRSAGAPDDSSGSSPAAAERSPVHSPHRNGSDPLASDDGDEAADGDSPRIAKAKKERDAALRERQREEEARRSPYRNEVSPPKPASAGPGAAAAVVAEPARRANSHGPTSGRIDLGGGHDVGQKTMRLILRNANDIAKQEGGGSLTFMGEVLRQAATESTRTVRIWFYAAALLLLILFTASIAANVIQFTQEQQLRERLASINEARATAIGSLDEASNRVAELERERRAERTAADNLRGALAASQQQVSDLREQLDVALSRADNRPPTERQRFQQVYQDFYESTYLLITEFTIRKGPGGEEEKKLSSGTGFVVTDSGYMVTNKHVIFPWKFGELAAEIAHNNWEVVPSSHQVYAWKNGEQIYRDVSRMWLDERNAYSTTNGLLRIHSDRPADVSERRYFGEFGRQTVHKSNDNADLAILKLEGGETPFRPVPIYDRTRTSFEYQQGDPIMIVGFPLGTQGQQSLVATSHLSMGTISYVEDTISVNSVVVPGNSGGPVFAVSDDGDPHVIGIITRVLKDQESYGFCIKIEHALRYVPDLE